MCVPHFLRAHKDNYGLIHMELGMLLFQEYKNMSETMVCSLPSSNVCPTIYLGVKLMAVELWF